MTPLRGFLVTFGACLLAAPLLAAPDKPVGTWKRESAPLVMSVTFTESKITARGEMKDDDGTAFKVVIDADYSMTSDGVIYGVISGIDGSPIALAPGLRVLDGQPFAMRVKVDGEVMHVRDVKIVGADMPQRSGDNPFAEFVPAVAGRYEAVDPPKPARKPAPPAALDDARILAPVVEIPPPQPYRTPTAPPRGAPVIPLIPNEIAPIPASSMNTIPPHILAQWEKDTGRVERAGIEFNALPTQPPAPVVAVRPAASPPQGAWVREMPGVRTTLTLGEQSLKAEVEFAVEMSKGVERTTIRFDTDYATTSDGLAFGVASGFELSMPDDAREDHRGEMAGLLARLDQAGGAMFKFRFRCEHGKMTVSELCITMPGEKCEPETEKNLAVIFGGRYQQSTGAARKPLKPGQPFCPTGGNCEVTPITPTPYGSPSLSPSGLPLQPYGVPYASPSEAPHRPLPLISRPYEPAPAPRPISPASY